MKNVIFLALIALFTGCAGTYKQASYISRQVYIGMPISDFQKIAGKKAKLAAMESGYTIYQLADYDAWSGALLDTKFYYFNNEGKLLKIDGGQREQSRQQVEIINK
jgi:hypothetical protein